MSTMTRPGRRVRLTRSGAPALALAAALLAACASTLTGCASPPRGGPASPPPAPAPRGDRIDALLEGLMSRHHVPGMAVAVVRGGKIEKMQTYGVADLEWPSPVTPETRFQIASVTKLMTGTLLMLLVQEGKLRLDDPVSRHLPDAPESWSGITVGHLAAHSSGIPDEWDMDAAGVAPAYEGLKQKPLRSPPGAEAVYGNADFIVLTQLLEKITGQPFQDLLRARLFQPLGFACTTFDHASREGPAQYADVIPQRASVYRWVDGRQRTTRFAYPEHSYAAGGLFSCLLDLAKWAAAMDRGELLTPASERTATTAFPLTGGREGGFSVAFAARKLHGLRAYGHSGGGSIADIIRVPDQGLTVIILSNQQRLYPNIASTIASLHLPPPPEEPGIPDTQPALTATLRAVLQQMTTGAVDEGPFAPSARTELVPALRELGPVQTAVLPPLERLVLREDRKDGDRRIRVYRSVHGPQIVSRWTFTLDADDRILDIDTAIE